jgi:hypothetical protein
MSCVIENPPPRGSASGSPKTVCVAADSQNPTRPAANVQGAFALLQKEFISECLRIVVIKAAHAADNFELGDDLAAERDLRLVVEHVREAGEGLPRA